jgi:hypothetical protein
MERVVCLEENIPLVEGVFHGVRRIFHRVFCLILGALLAAGCEDGSSDKKARKREFYECFDVHCILWL